MKRAFLLFTFLLGLLFVAPVEASHPNPGTCAVGASQLSHFGWSTPAGTYTWDELCSNSCTSDSQCQQYVDPTDVGYFGSNTYYGCFGYNGGGKCVVLRYTGSKSGGSPTPTSGGGNGAPACDPSRLTMAVTPNPVGVGANVRFNTSGGEGSTHNGDTWSGGVNCSGGFWGEKTCQATTEGTFTWTHTWKNCAPNDCSKTSAQCSKQLSFTVGAGQPTHTPTPTMTATPVVTNTPTPTRTPTPTPVVFTTHYKISEVRGEVTSFDANTWSVYERTEPIKIENYRFRDLTPGNKIIYVGFRDHTGRIEVKSETIKFNPNPVITRVNCTYDASTISGTLVTIEGRYFGANAQNHVKVNGRAAEIRSWDDVLPPTPTPGLTGSPTPSPSPTPITGTPTPTSSAPTTLYSTIVARAEDRPQGEITVEVKTQGNKTVQGKCRVNLTSLAFETKVDCRPAGNFALTNVDVTVAEAVTGSKPVYKQKININAKGEPQNFAPTLERGKKYNIIIKAPQTLARKFEFTAEEGSTNLGRVDLPSGDIAPANAPDGKINAVDKSELSRQWNAISDVTRSADFNLDSRVNSVDYSCMKLNFNKQDEQ